MNLAVQIGLQKVVSDRTMLYFYQSRSQAILMQIPLNPALYRKVGASPRSSFALVLPTVHGSNQIEHALNSHPSPNPAVRLGYARPATNMLTIVCGPFSRKFAWARCAQLKV